MRFPTAKVLLLIDPTERKRGGIATYCNLALPLLRSSYLNIVHLKRHAGEEINVFRARVGALVREYGSDLLQVEAPETYAATLYLPAHVNVHVRLHCARSLGALWEGLPIDEKILAEERRVIANATSISSPTYAAWRETNRLAQVHAAHVFGNPPPSYHGGQKGVRSGVVLIGRAQALKGIHYLAEMIKYLPKSIPVILAGPGMKAAASRMQIVRRIEAQDEIDEAGVRRLLSGAASCLVASPFETFSMVAVEALAANTPVVTWAHSGTAELAPAPFIWTAPAWNVAALAHAVELSIAASLPSSENIIIDLKNKFTAGHLSLRSFAAPAIWGKHSTDIFSIPTPPTHSDAMTYQATATPLQRKVRKLFRNPRRFLADAKIIKKASPTLALRLQSGFSAPKPVAVLPKAHSLGSTFTGIRYGVALRSSPSKQGSVLNDLSGPDARVRSLFVLDETTAWSEVGLLREMQSIGAKFSLLNSSHVALATFIGVKEATFESYLAGIAPAERGKLAAIQNIIVSSNSISFGRALRACHPGSRLFIIVRPGAAKISIPDEEIDVLIAPVGFAVSGLKLRRLMRYPSVGVNNSGINSGIAGALLRACQEAAPKPLDILLPAFGNCQYDPTLLDVDTKTVQGVLLCNCPVPLTAEQDALGIPATFDQQLALLEGCLEGVLLCESVLWRYRTLIDLATGPSEWLSVIKLAAYDGIRFELKHLETITHHHHIQT